MDAELNLIYWPEHIVYLFGFLLSFGANVCGSRISEYQKSRDRGVSILDGTEIELAVQSFIKFHCFLPLIKVLLGSKRRPRIFLDIYILVI